MNRTRPLQRLLASALTVCLTGMQITQTAMATDLADIPMAVKNIIEPNIMFTLDDSGSMQWEIMPDQSIFNDTYFMFPRVDDINNPIDPSTGSRYYASGSEEYFDRSVGFDTATNRYSRILRWSGYNRTYYNPDVRYDPWPNADGSLMPPATPTAAWHNPKNTSVGSRNLTVDNSRLTSWLKDNGSFDFANKTFYPATYCRYVGTLPGPTAPNDAKNTAANFQCLQVKPATVFPSKAAARTDCAGAVCTYAEEMQNFANWYQYYRSRTLLARGGAGAAFANLTSATRVGFGTINYPGTTIDSQSSPGTIIKGVRAFSGTSRTDFFDKLLYQLPVPARGTPLRRALDDVGQYFKRTDDKGPWGTNPGSGGGIQYACRQNYHILTTDGYWSGFANSANFDTAAARHASRRANSDSTAGPTNSNTTSSYTYAAVAPYSDSRDDTLADVAMYYWKNDLRPDLDNKVPTNALDPAFWQHLVNFTVGLGVFGSVSQADIQSALNGGAPNINWPNPNSSDLYKTDDLAHAAINSRGGFFSAQNPTEFAQSLTSSLNNVLGRTTNNSALAVASFKLTEGDNFGYEASYNSGTWSGELKAIPINLDTGTPDADHPIWTAQTLLDARTASDRIIFSHTGGGGEGQGIQFQPATAATSTKLTTAQQTLLDSPAPAGPGDGAAVIAYLRGDRTGETAGTYRVRAHLLGDLINSEPSVVGSPLQLWFDAGYQDYKIDKIARQRMIYVGGNDGMLHAFNATSGREEWAFVPSLVLPTLNQYTRRTGFSHRFYVDGSPTSSDVDMNNTGGTNGAGAWRTILVGGLNKGGRGYYALDITDPISASESGATSRVLWEFPNSDPALATVRPNVGYSYGKPVIVKTRAYGWVVLVTSGYNNGTDTGGDGQGYLYVLNARNGQLLKTLGTGAGSAADPSGLAQIQAFVENDLLDRTAVTVYGGDLKGNMWRFDVSDPDPANWNVTKLATLKDAGNQIQPITTAPELTSFTTDGFTVRMVYVGTGQYLGDTDIPGTVGANAHATQTQAIYGLRDSMDGSEISPLRSNLQQQTWIGTGGSRTASSNNVNFAEKKGWYIDLETNERANTNPLLLLGALGINTNIPNADPCQPGGIGYSNFFDFKTGGFTDKIPTLTNTTVQAAGLLIHMSAIEARGRVYAISRCSGTNCAGSGQYATTRVGANPVPAAVRRISWRELPDL
ncbi:MAG: Type IV pilus biogenesis factor PilY1 [Rhodocyclaceae bacterium]|nr:Type IV pilus biogenesis factor PilY1 [Rhodocyclaceae bacterium]